jgi:hypothetical protein
MTVERETREADRKREIKREREKVIQFPEQCLWCQGCRSGIEGKKEEEKKRKVSCKKNTIIIFNAGTSVINDKMSKSRPVNF